MDPKYEAYQFFVLVVAVLAIVPALIFESLRSRKNPNTLTFAWGYWCACGTIGISFIWFLFCVVEDSTGERWAWGILAILYAFLGLLMFKRMRLAWIVATVLSLNPIIWLINGLYLRKRWLEMVDWPFSRPKSTDATPPEPGPAYLIHDGDIQSGPFSLEEIHAALKCGRIPAIAYYWCDGMAEWTPIEQLPTAANSTASMPTMIAAERSDPQVNRPAIAPVPSKRVDTARPLALGQNRFPRVHRSYVLWALGVFCLVAILWATHGRIWSIITPARPPAPADAAPQPQAQTVANRPSAVLPMETLQFSLSKNGVRHRAGCKYFSASQLCGPTEGRACKVCGG